MEYDYFCAAIRRAESYQQKSIKIGLCDCETILSLCKLCSGGDKSSPYKKEIKMAASNGQWTQQAIDDTFKKVIERAAADQKFRSLALSNPNEAVEEVSGRSVPPGVNIRFVDNAGAHFTVVLPDGKSGDASELSDAQLEQVAGGRGSACSGVCNPMALSVTG